MRALQGLEPARVVYVGTTSKTLAPGLRMGWIAAPPALVDELRETKNLLDAGSPALPQLALARLLRTGEYARHVRRVRTIYRRRRDLLIHALETRLPGLAIEGVAAGVHLLLRLPAGVSDTHAVELACARGLRVEALSSHCIAPSASGGLVLGYGRLHETAIPAAVRELAAALRPLTASRRLSLETGSARGVSRRAALAGSAASRAPIRRGSARSRSPSRT